MNQKNIEELLTRHGVRSTANRILVASVIAEADHPVSQIEIETVLVTVDRSTISRSVGVFLEAGILHLVDDGSGMMKYEMCHAHKENDDDDDDEHLHFHCRKCGRTFCLQHILVPNVDLPEGFIREKSNFVLTGLCDSCSTKTPSHKKC